MSQGCIRAGGPMQSLNGQFDKRFRYPAKRLRYDFIGTEAFRRQNLSASPLDLSCASRTRSPDTTNELFHTDDELVSNAKTNNVCIYLTASQSGCDSSKHITQRQPPSIAPPQRVFHGKDKIRLRKQAIATTPRFSYGVPKNPRSLTHRHSQFGKPPNRTMENIGNKNCVELISVLMRPRVYPYGTYTLGNRNHDAVTTMVNGKDHSKLRPTGDIQSVYNFQHDTPFVQRCDQEQILSNVALHRYGVNPTNSPLIRDQVKRDDAIVKRIPAMTSYNKAAAVAAGASLQYQPAWVNNLQPSKRNHGASSVNKFNTRQCLELETRTPDVTAWLQPDNTMLNNIVIAPDIQTGKIVPEALQETHRMSQPIYNRRQVPECEYTTHGTRLSTQNGHHFLHVYDSDIISTGLYKIPTHPYLNKSPSGMYDGVHTLPNQERFVNGNRMLCKESEHGRKRHYKTNFREATNASLSEQKSISNASHTSSTISELKGIIKDHIPNNLESSEQNELESNDQPHANNSRNGACFPWWNYHRISENITDIPTTEVVENKKIDSILKSKAVKPSTKKINPTSLKKEGVSYGNQLNADHQNSPLLSHTIDESDSPTVKSEIDLAKNQSVVNNSDGDLLSRVLKSVGIPTFEEEAEKRESSVSMIQEPELLRNEFSDQIADVEPVDNIRCVKPQENNFDKICQSASYPKIDSRPCAAMSKKEMILSAVKNDANLQELNRNLYRPISGSVDIDNTNENLSNISNVKDETSVRGHPMKVTNACIAAQLRVDGISEFSSPNRGKMITSLEMPVLTRHDDYSPLPADFTHDDPPSLEKSIVSSSERSPSHSLGFLREMDESVGNNSFSSEAITSTSGMKSTLSAVNTMNGTVRRTTLEELCFPELLSFDTEISNQIKSELDGQGENSYEVEKMSHVPTSKDGKNKMSYKCLINKNKLCEEREPLYPPSKYENGGESSNCATEFRSTVFEVTCRNQDANRPANSQPTKGSTSYKNVSPREINSDCGLSAMEYRSETDEEVKPPRVSTEDLRELTNVNILDPENAQETIKLQTPPTDISIDKTKIAKQSPLLDADEDFLETNNSDCKGKPIVGNAAKSVIALKSNLHEWLHEFSAYLKFTDKGDIRNSQMLTDGRTPCPNDASQTKRGYKDRVALCLSDKVGGRNSAVTRLSSNVLKIRPGNKAKRRRYARCLSRKNCSKNYRFDDINLDKKDRCLFEVFSDENTKISNEIKGNDRRYSLKRDDFFLDNSTNESRSTNVYDSGCVKGRADNSRKNIRSRMRSNVLIPIHKVNTSKIKRSHSRNKRYNFVHRRYKKPRRRRHRSENHSSHSQGTIKIDEINHCEFGGFSNFNEDAATKTSQVRVCARNKNEDVRQIRDNENKDKSAVPGNKFKIYRQPRMLHTYQTPPASTRHGRSSVDSALDVPKRFPMTALPVHASEFEASTQQDFATSLSLGARSQTLVSSTHAGALSSFTNPPSDSFAGTISDASVNTSCRTTAPILGDLFVVKPLQLESASIKSSSNITGNSQSSTHSDRSVSDDPISPLPSDSSEGPIAHSSVIPADSYGALPIDVSVGEQSDLESAMGDSEGFECHLDSDDIN